MIDVQNQIDTRGIKIQQTGVTNVYLPFSIWIGKEIQQVLARLRFTVSLNKNIRGTHMSRLMEILTDFSATPLKISDIEKIVKDATEKLETDFSAIKMEFKFF
jgi:GTP cyclohydrolase I